MKKLAIITTHPIQYNAPWFRLLAERKKIEINVFYTWSQLQDKEKFDPGFGKVIEWDIPLLDGYDSTFVKNISKNPGSKTFKGIQNPTLIKEINAWQADAVLVFGWKFKSHLKALRYFHKKIPVLFRGDSTTINEHPGLKKWFKYFLLRRIYKTVDVALYVGTENKKYFIESGLEENQLCWAPHAVDHKRFLDNDPLSVLKAQEFRKQLQVAPDDLVFLYAGKFEEIKNPLLFLRTALTFHKSNVHFVLVGNGPLESEMKKKRGDNIHFFNFQNQKEMPAVYSLADVVVLPSRSETWGLAVNEAMACGKPVLVSDACGCAADLVVEGKTGYTFRSDDANDLRKKIALMISKEGELKEMGNNALLKIQDWSFDHIVEAIEDLVIHKC